MQHEYGGYLPLELTRVPEYFARFPGARMLRLNSGRNAIAAALNAVKPSKVYIPYYNCDVVRETVEKHGYQFEYYYLNAAFEPDVDTIHENEWLLYVNYFGGCSKERMLAIANKFGRVIFDNTQGFFAEPILQPDVFNAYSPRKFIGLVDGAYLVWDGNIPVPDQYPKDVSWDRAEFLFKSIELGTNAAYQDNIRSKAGLGDEIRLMSDLTRRMLESVDYDDIQARRYANYCVLHEKLRFINQLPADFQSRNMMVYPLLVRSPELRRKLVENKIYVPQWWKYLLNMVRADSLEADLSQWLLPLPIDQRYSCKDMSDLADIVLHCNHE